MSQTKAQLVSPVGILTASEISVTSGTVGILTSSEISVTSGTVGILTSSGISVSGATTSTSFVKSGGTSDQFLKADGSVDNSDYATTFEATGKAVAMSIVFG